MPIMRNEEDNYLNRLSDKDLDSLIDNLCSARENNPDVVIMDQIQSGQIPLSEEEANDQAMNAMMEDIIDSTINSGVPLSIEEVNSFKAAGIYNTYLNKLYNRKEDNNIMQSMEEELRQGLANEESVTEVVSDTVVTENTDTSFQEATQEPESIVETETVAITEPAVVTPSTVVEKPNETIGELVEEINSTVNDIVNTNIAEVITSNNNGEEVEEVVDTTMTQEEFNDVPATAIDVDDNTLLSAVTADLGEDIDIMEGQKLLSVISRYKSGEKFKVFDELPDAFKRKIMGTLAACGADPANREFFAKTYINDIVNNTFLDKEINDFNVQLKEALAPMSNISGTMMDEYTDESYNNFTVKMEEAADKIESEDPEKAKELREVSKSMKEATSLSRVLDQIEHNPSTINRAYKQARDNGTDFIRTYDQTVSKLNPSPRTIRDYKTSLVNTDLVNQYDDAYIDTLIVLVGNSVLSAIESGTLVEHIYAYYASNAIHLLATTAGNSEVNKITTEAVTKILDKIKAYMLPLESRNTRKNRKRNNKR